MSSPTACVCLGVGKGIGGNREVPPRVLLGMRGDLSGAGAEADSKEGGSWGKHGFPHESEPKARDAHSPHLFTSSTSSPS
jgi:hypothetical protein